MSRRFLEYILQSELHLAIGQVRVGDLPETPITEIRVWVRKLRCVKHIEEFRSKLQRMSFMVRHVEALAK